MAQALNRAQRRKIGSEILKVRDQSKAKKQWVIGFVITNLVCTITIWRWSIVLYDKRLAI